MPEESKKNQQKKKNEPKDQRKPRQSRHQNVPIEKKAATENKVDGPKVVQTEKPVYEEPGPEFYKNLKRETDEILKITEEANSKYKKKEIKSNWSKYEMPIETYEEMEEQESIGADYEKLIQAPLSIGGHFQFKHEKTWSVETEPSLYDKYFEINMDILATAISTIPFYERNNIDKNIFHETDILSMKNRSTKYKQKYYNNKTYTTPELETQEKILKTLKENLVTSEENIHKINNQNIKGEPSENKEKLSIIKSKELTEEAIQNINTEEVTLNLKNIELEVTNEVKPTHNIDTTLKNNIDNENDIDILLDKDEKNINYPANELTLDVKKIETPVEDKKVIILGDKKASTETITPVTETKTPVIESPEDLEKWLDDFLDE